MIKVTKIFQFHAITYGQNNKNNQTQKVRFLGILKNFKENNFARHFKIRNILKMVQKK